MTTSGIRAVLVKPAGKREAVVTIKGIHPNTKDEMVLDYLAKFGNVVTQKVVYGLYTEGPLLGLRNGDRSFKMEIKPSTSLGSYHVIDRQRVSLRYPGQQQTCARCLEPAQHCRGKGMAKRCEAEGGLKADFNEYILKLWGKIGYQPREEQVDSAGGGIEKVHQVIQTEGEFTPQKCFSDSRRFAGVVVKNIPRDTDHGEIVEFLVMSGLPEEKREDVDISSNGSVTIRSLDTSQCSAIIDSIHGKKKLFCNGYVPLTLQKESIGESVTPDTGSGHNSSAGKSL